MTMVAGIFPQPEMPKIRRMIPHRALGNFTTTIRINNSLSFPC